MKTLRFSILVLAAGLSQAVWAHTQLSESVPADQAVIESAPEAIMLHFSEPVRLTALAVQQADGRKQSLGPLPADASEHFSITAPALADGVYTVSWRALSEDTHVVTGEFSFTVGAVRGHSDQSARTESPQGGAAAHAGHQAHRAAESIVK